MSNVKANVLNRTIIAMERATAQLEYVQSTLSELGLDTDASELTDMIGALRNMGAQLDVVRRNWKDRGI